MWIVPGANKEVRWQAGLDAMLFAITSGAPIGGGTELLRSTMAKLLTDCDP